MASAKTMEFLFLFISIFTGLLISFGQTSPTLARYILGPLFILMAPFPDFGTVLQTQGFTGLVNCAWWDASCHASNVAQATIFLASAFIWGIGMFFAILNKIGAGLFLIFGLISFMNTDLGVPFLGYIFTAFIAMVILYGLTLIRGNPTGA